MLLAPNVLTSWATDIWRDKLSELSAIATVVQAFFAILGGVFVYFEYCSSKESQRLQLAHKMVDQIAEDPRLMFCTIVLDWGVGAIPVPPEWQAYVGAPHIIFDKAKVEEALSPKLTEPTSMDPTRLMYRHAFVRLFDHLERIQQMIDAKVIFIRHLSNLVWMAHKLTNPDYISRNTFIDAMKVWYPSGAPKRLVDSLIKIPCGPPKTLS